MANKVNPPTGQKTTTPKDRKAAYKPRRHVGSSADFVQTAPVIGSTSLPPKPTITPTLEGKSASARSEAEPKPEAQAPQPLPAAHEPVRSDSGMFTFRMKQETLVLLALVVCSLLLGAFILGHRVGKFRAESKMAREDSARAAKKAVSNKGTLSSGSRKTANRVIQIGSRNPALPPTPTPKKRTPAAAPAGTSGVWTLCVITYTASQEDRAEQLRRVLSEAVPAQYKVFIKRSGNRRLVCVGHFNSSRDPVLMELKSTVSKLKFEGKQQFRDCYPVRLKQ